MENGSHDIMQEIDNLLQEVPGYDPTEPGIDVCWERLFRTARDPPRAAATSSIVATSHANGIPHARTVPQVGTSIQRSDAAN